MGEEILSACEPDNLQPILDSIDSGAHDVLLVSPRSTAIGRSLKVKCPSVVVWAIQPCGTSEATEGAEIDHVINADFGNEPVLPVGDVRFDCVVLDKSLGQLSDPNRFLASLKQYLRDGGAVVCSERNACHWPVLSELTRGRFRDISVDGATRSFTPSDLQSTLFEAGYSIVCERATLQPRPDDETLASFGIRPESLSTDHDVSELTVTAKPLAPQVSAGAGELGPASSDGVSVIVLAFNSAKTLDACVNSVLGTLGPDDELIIVDNGSSDGTEAMLTSLSNPFVKTILNGANLGFSAGSNVGLRAAKGVFLCLLNPDTVVFPGWLEGLKGRLADDTVGMVGPVSNTVAGDQFVGHYVQPGVPLARLPGECKEEFEGLSRETKLLIGFCAMASRKVWNQVGLLDEELFLGSDDLELSWRIRTHGLRLAVALDVYIYHSGSASFASVSRPEVDKLLMESTTILKQKIRQAYGWLPTSFQIWGADLGG